MNNQIRWVNLPTPPPSYYENLIKDYPPAERRRLLEGEWIIAVDPAAPGGDKTVRALVRNGKVEQVIHE